MARVEITKSRGPEAIESWNGATVATGNYGPIVNVGNYTLHSYQVINTGNSIVFNIIGSNVADSDGSPSTDFQKDWTIISTHNISAGSTTNPSSIAYSDSWNFKFSSFLITNASIGVRVLEKHNP